MTRCVRVIDCGGSGFRRADVFGNKVTNIVTTHEIGLPVHLVEFSECSLLPETEAIIYCSAGIIENHSKIIISPNISILNGFNLGLATKEATGKPSFVCNDAEGFVTGMASLFPELSYFMGITWSSGIGIRIWKNKEILSDSEAGHIRLDYSAMASECGCKKRGCAEALIGGKAVTQRVLEEVFHQSANKIPDGVHPCDWLNKCYISGEPWAVAYYREYIVIVIAMFLTNIQTIFHLPAVVWKGKFGRRAFEEIPHFEEMVREEAKKMIINPQWIDDMAFFISPEPPKDRDSFVGAAQIALKLISH